MAGGKIVDSNDFLAECEEVLQQARADEPRDAGDDPDFGCEWQALSKKLIRSGDHKHATKASSIPHTFNCLPLISRIATGAY
jgi:hypothetical protein